MIPANVSLGEAMSERRKIVDRMASVHYDAIDEGEHRLVGLNGGHLESPARACQGTQGEGVIGLPALDAEVRNERDQDWSARRRVDRPDKKWSAVRRCGRASAAIPPEQIPEQVNGLGRDLLHLNARLVNGLGRVTPDPHGVGVAVDSDVTIRVHHPSAVSKVCRFHSARPFAREWRTSDPGQLADALQIEKPEIIPDDQLSLLDYAAETG